MQFNGQARPPVGVIFDAAFGDTLDDFLTLCLLYGLDNKNECRVISLSTAKDNVHSAAVLDILNRMYGGRPFPIGMALAKQRGTEGKLLQAAMEHQTPAVKSMIDTAEPHGLIRNALTAQNDGNAVAICMGPTDNFADLLRLETARPVIAAKLKTLYIVGENPKAIEGWPTPIVLVPHAMAAGLRYRPRATDFAWNETHPAAQALAASADELNHAGMLTVLHAVRGKDFPLPLSAEQTPAAEKAMAELTCAKPIPRQRFRPPSA